ncbi:MAG TPA: zf-TFIIB domain-containing protein [Kofleriaceae bacterium]|nr:zf-TFIIB domain-containing protein [Kofleriaceae bacterium]
MTADPYRDQPRACPACQATLRDFQTRLACDACQGVMLSIADLQQALAELTGIEPKLELVDEMAGRRNCPRCAKAMTICHIRVVLDDEIAKPRPELDRCRDHGIWFDGQELAKVFEKSLSKVQRGRGLPMGWSGNASGFSWWNSGNMR